MAKQERKEPLKILKKRISPKIIERGDRGLPEDQRFLGELENLSLPGQTRHEIQGILFGAATVFLMVSLLSYHYYADNPISLPGQAASRNITGIVGAMVAHVGFQYFGYLAYAFPFITLALALDKFRGRPRFVDYGNLMAAGLGILSACALLGLPFLGSIYTPGGIIGAVVANLLEDYLNAFGSVVVLATGLLMTGLLFKKYLFQPLPWQEQLLLQTEEPAKPPRIVRPQSPPAVPQESNPPAKTFRARLTDQLKKKSAPVAGEQEELALPTGFFLPPITLLNKPPHAEKIRTGMEQQLLKNSEVLEEKLLDFGIEGKIVGVLPGPVITRYEFQPAPGIKVSRIVNLADDLALAMKAISVRIVAPVPGKDVVGMEVPNEHKEFIYLRDILEAKTFANHPSKLALGLGKDIGGRPYVTDLGKMPHILIAGATGSGKSVCLNGLICSILFHATPAEVQFIMIDPKMLELGVYDGIPHLLVPVVKDPQYAANALNWATEEMTKRYGILAQKGVRNIAQYNEAILDLQKRQPADAAQTGEMGEKPLPYIVVIVDELADLMMVAAGVEKPIMRLAQMARAVGIHLILATQRPSVDVITGVIKANFPARISFRVSSKVDSRTILDANGAEILLGDGDMLFLLPGTSRILRVHGAYVSEKEIKRLTTALKRLGQPHYDQAVLLYGEDKNGEDEDDEVLYEKAVRLVVTSGEASVSMLRRNLKIGHSRASRLIDSMEKDRVVGTFRGTRPREIVLTPEELDTHFQET